MNQSETKSSQFSVSQLIDGVCAHLEHWHQEGIDDLGASPLEKVRQWLGDCTRCKLHQLGRKQIVFGVGNPHAKLMFIGEAPGEEEDKRGEPFVGRAGELLTKIIEAMGFSRAQVYIANTVKCRPPKNRNPEPDELAACEPFWKAQVKEIKPEVIVTLGNVATQTVLGTTEGISKLRGRFHRWENIQIMPTYHPAFLLRSPDMKKHTWEDMKKVRDLLQGEAQ